MTIQPSFTVGLCAVCDDILYIPIGEIDEKEYDAKVFVHAGKCTGNYQWADHYQLLADDPRHHLRAGDVLACLPYYLDPEEKLAVCFRVPDGFDPECTLHRNEVTRAAGKTRVRLRLTEPYGFEPASIEELP